MWKLLPEIFVEIAEKHGVFVAFVLIVLLFFFSLVYWLIRVIIKSKDREIERLVKERNKLQNLFIRKRLSTTEKKVEEK